MNSLFKENRTLNLVQPVGEKKRRLKLARQEAGKLAGSGTFEGQTSTQLAQKLTPKAPIVTKPKKVVQPKSGGTILTPEELKQRRADAFSTPREESKSAAERGATIVPDIPTAKTAQEIAAETGANVGDAFSSLTPTQRLENLVAQQKDEEKQLELKLAPKRSRIAEQLEAAKAGAETRFAESAEGVQTSTAAGLVSRATAGAETQAQASLDTMNAAQESLRQLNQRIQTKAVRGEETRQLEQQAAGIQKAIDEATEELEASGAKATQDVFDLVQNSDQAQLESFANMDSSSFFDTIKLRSPNITLPQSLILQDLAKSRFNAGKLDPESIEGRAALAKVQAAESALLSEADKQIKNFQKLKAALDAGEISQAFFDKETLGVEPLTPLDRQIKEADLVLKNAEGTTAQAEAQAALNDLQDFSGYTSSNVNTIDVTSSLDKDMTADEVYEAAGLTRTGDEIFKGECSALINDVLKEPSKYGSTLESKKRNMTPGSDPLKPKAGSVFVSGIGNSEIGHCGFVESVDYVNKTATLFDINRYDDQKTSRRENIPFDKLVSEEGIIGYEHLATTARTGGTKPKTQVEKWQDEALKLGINKKSDVDDFVDTKMKEAAKGLNEVQSKKFTAYVMMKPELDLYNEITEDLDMVEFANALDAISRAAEKAEEQGVIMDMTDDFIRSVSSSEAVQRAILSEKRWIEGKLREESGAAISAGEYLGNGNEFYPRPGNTEQVIADKKAARERATESKFAVAGTSGQLKAEELLSKSPSAATETRAQKLERREREAQENVSDEEMAEIEEISGAEEIEEIT